MLDRILFQIASAIIAHLDKRISDGRVAVDAVVDRARLVRAGDRIRGWMRENGAGVGGEPDAGGGGGAD